jgi:hypothetical protein
LRKTPFFRRKLSKIAEKCDHNIDPWQDDQPSVSTPTPPTSAAPIKTEAASTPTPDASFQQLQHQQYSAYQAYPAMPQQQQVQQVTDALSCCSQVKKFLFNF